MAEAVPSLVSLPDKPASDLPEPEVLLRSLAHELRQPLSVIESIACYLDMRLPGEAAALRPHVAKLAQMVDAANAILAGALDYLEAAPLHPRVLDLHELLEAELESWADARCWCVPRTECGPALVRMDRGQAVRLLGNLGAAARRLLPPAAQVYLQAWREGSEWILQLMIPGADFSREQLLGLFEPFGAPVGTSGGLALASARRIAELNGGNLEATTAGGALLMTLRLPLEQ